MFGVAESTIFVGLAFRPRTGVRIGSVHRAEHPRRPFAFLVALEFLQRGQQCPGGVRTVVASFQAQVPGAAAHRGLELDERRDDTVTVTVIGGGLAGPEPRRVRAGQSVLQHVADGVAALHRLEIPGERHQVAPEAVDGEHAGDPRDIAGGQGRLELGEPGVRTFLGRDARGGGNGKISDLCHVSQHTPGFDGRARPATPCNSFALCASSHTTGA